MVSRITWPSRRQATLALLLFLLPLGARATPDEAICSVVLVSSLGVDSPAEVALSLSAAMAQRTGSPCPVREPWPGCEGSVQGCRPEGGQGRGITYAVVAAVGLLASTMVLDLALVDLDQGREVRTYRMRVQRGEGSWAEVARGAVEALVPEDLPARLILAPGPEGVRYMLDGVPREPGALMVVPGNHVLVAYGPYHPRASQMFHLPPGSVRRVEAPRAVALPSPTPAVEPAESPWYTRWWVWSLVGVAVATAVAVPLAIILPGGEEPPGGDRVISVPFR